VVLDETVSNSIRHGAAREIRVRLALDGGRLVLEVEDDGVAFDPRTAPAPDLDAPAEDRRPGGLGVPLCRALMERIEYERDGALNRLRLSRPL
jgi:serine/threonine-protein kinase RsbW